MKLKSAFPIVRHRIDTLGRVVVDTESQENGMSFREYAAVAAMQGLLACEEQPIDTCENNMKKIAHASVAYADALIEELEKGGKS